MSRCCQASQLSGERGCRRRHQRLTYERDGCAASRLTSRLPAAAGYLEQAAPQAPALPFSDVLHISFASFEALREPLQAERELLGDTRRDTAASVYFDAALAEQRFAAAYRVTVVSATRLPDSGLFWVRSSAPAALAEMPDVPVAWCKPALQGAAGPSFRAAAPAHVRPLLSCCADSQQLIRRAQHRRARRRLLSQDLGQGPDGRASLG